jgi:hypothetical protein
LKTASFFTFTGPGRISIARFAPRNTPAGFRVFRPLAPGSWFNSVPEAMYRKLYGAQLSLLNAAEVHAALIELAGGHEPILLCWENPKDITAGKTFCHRHIAASWIESELGILVPELIP